jgi:hypothetical protein
LAVLITAISTMTGAQSCRVDTTLIALASMLATLGFTVHVYKHTKEAAIRKLLLPLIFFLAFVIAVITLAVVVCLKKAGGAFQSLRRDISMGLLGDSVFLPSSLVPARA